MRDLLRDWAGAGDPREPGVSKAAQQPHDFQQPDGRLAGRRLGRKQAQHVAWRLCAASSLHAVRTCRDLHMFRGHIRSRRHTNGEL